MNPNTLPPGLMLVHGNRSERLRDLLVEWMKRYPLAPLENEIILVQSNGIAQWLKLALAAHTDSATGEGGCGIAVALDIVLPSRFIWQAYRSVLGASNVAEVSPFDKSRLVWRLMRVVPALVGRAEFEPLKRFISRDDDRRKRYQLAERIADLFEQYQMYRADWLANWAKGDDVAIDARGERSSATRGTALAGGAVARTGGGSRAFAERRGRRHRVDGRPRGGARSVHAARR